MGNKHSTLKSLFDDIADSIRNKTGSTGDIVADDFPEAIDGIRTGDIQLANIAITKQPTKTSYTAKEAFNSAGMEVEAIFSNDASKRVFDGLKMSGYKLLQYIESTGTQYINLNIVPSNHAFEIKFDTLEYNSEESIFGTASDYLYYHFSLYQNKYYWGQNGSEGNGGQWSTGIKTLLYNMGENHAVILDGETLGSGLNISSTSSLKLCHRTAVYYRGRIYYCKLVNRATNLVVRDCIPCIDPNGNVGLFDLVEGKFYGNNGSGSFVAGPEAFQSFYDITNGNSLTAGQNSVTISYEEFGVTKTLAQEVSVQPISVALPTFKGGLTYSGSAQTPSWNGYDSSIMSIGGTTSGVNAGSYSAVFSLKDKVNYAWADGTTADKSVAWSIGKAQASITLDKTSVVLNGDKLTETVIISSVGMSSIMVMSSDMSVATVSLDGNVLTISSVDETKGTATIVINGTVDSNYNAPEYPSVEVSAEFYIYINSIPSQSGSLYYNGEVLSPTWENYDSSQLTISGVTSGTNIGAYEVQFTPIDGYRWSDGSNMTKTVVWRIVDNWPVILQDFNYTQNPDGTATLTAWKRTLNGASSTELVIPDNPRVVM